MLRQQLLGRQRGVIFRQSNFGNDTESMPHFQLLLKNKSVQPCIAACSSFRNNTLTELQADKRTEPGDKLTEAAR
jgi:hypothetical protein